jgi:hypothetical protein
VKRLVVQRPSRVLLEAQYSELAADRSFEDLIEFMLSGPGR